MILALQCCPHDSAQAIELTRLICDIHGQNQSRHEWAICARRDTAEDHVKAMHDLAAQHFAAVHVVKGQRPDVGWPEGPNALWAETMLRISLLRKNKRTAQTGVLTFEADCVPLRADWLDVLDAQWQAAEAAGKDVLGHAHGNPPDHINGNAIFRIGLLRQYPQLNAANRRKGWDHYHGELLLGLGYDTDAITQVYNLHEYDRAFLEAVRKNGTVPALFHGCKGMHGIRAVRAMHEDGTLRARVSPGIGGLRAYKYPTEEDIRRANATPPTQEYSGSQ